MRAMSQVKTGPAVDAASARNRLLRAALALFALQGFAKTSTREIAEAAQVNVASIAYYFGDKAGLYRAVFLGPLAEMPPPPAPRDGAEPTLEDALRVLYAGFIAPLAEGDAARQCMKLHMREMIEPTGLWDDLIAREIRPSHDALLALLCRHFGLAAADADVERLAVCLAGLGIHLHLGRDVIDTLAPQLNAAPASIQAWLDRLVMYALAMVDAERRRRAGSPDRKTRP